MMGKDLVQVPRVAAGNVVAIGGLLVSVMMPCGDVYTLFVGRL